MLAGQPRGCQSDFSHSRANREAVKAVFSCSRANREAVKTIFHTRGPTARLSR